jgi:S-DNA-T family DNA segregation ATPase FtsK/SpoIIIE
VRHWDWWLGALLLTLACLGIMGRFYPELHPGTASLAQVSAGGYVGKAIGSGSWGVFRIVLFSGAAIAILAPHQTRRFLLWLKDKAFPALVRGGSKLKGWLCARLQRRRIPIKREIAPAAKEAKPEVKREQPPTMPVEEAPPKELISPVLGQLPPLELIDEAPKIEWSQADNEARAKLLEEALVSYGVEAKVARINPGPAVTQFGVEPGWDRRYRRVGERLEEVSKTRVKVERIASLANDLALALAVPSVRIEAPVPGTGMVGVEVPNTGTALVSLREVLESAEFHKLNAKSKLTVALGKGAGGEPAAASLARMPHLLIAGATGTGKTVCLSSIILCLLMHNTPTEMRLILIDPKRVELIAFNGVPHLMTPIVTEVNGAIESLRRVTAEMDNRYRKMATVAARNIEAYNQKALEPMPYLVVVIDELADLMMSSPDVIEPLICRLAQLSRATGIHLVVATQRPSVDVVTGLIKANFPTRISFAVTSAVDSRTILDASGAERLLGRGDMLYLPADAIKPKRLRGCFVSEQEIIRVVDFWREWSDATDHVAQDFVSLKVAGIADEPLLQKARELAREHKHISTSLLQRRLRIGYPRAARIMDLLEEEGAVSTTEPEIPGDEDEV